MKPSNLTLRLSLALALSTAAMSAVCVVALLALVGTSEQTRAVVSREVSLLRHAAAFDALIYQKGFVANYMLTRDPSWLQKLERTRAEFEGWIANPPAWLSARDKEVLDALVLEDARYDRLRREALRLFDAGETQTAVAMIPAYHSHIENLVNLAQRFSSTIRHETERGLVAAESTIHRLAWLLVLASLVSALANVTVGFLWARRIAQPMYRLQLEVESAAERTKFHIADAVGAAPALPERIVALVDKVEQADAALAEQRRRLIQSEKMSAIGELSAKLGHEILNPLAGMRAAVQLMDLQAESGELSAGELREGTRALEREITRIEQLVRRLIGYARPLLPELETCRLPTILDTARAAVETELRDRRYAFVTETIELPPLCVDPTLMTQVFVNLYRNAAQAMPGGGTIRTRVRRFHGSGDEVSIEVSDDGSGFEPACLGSLFTPFRSSKPSGHGLGLATCRNIVVEHGGRIEAENRTDGPGAVLRVTLPLDAG